MPPNLKLNAVAFISPQNYPILIRTFVKQEDPVKYHYIAHTSLDIIEERGSCLTFCSGYRKGILTQPLADSNCWGKDLRMLPGSVVCHGGHSRLWIYHAFESQDCHSFSAD
jgi:hypothetical protein